MNLRYLLLVLIGITAPLQSVKVLNPKDILNLWVRKCFKIKKLDLKKDWIVVQTHYDPKKEIPLFRYTLSSEEERFSFYNKEFKDIKNVTLYLPDDLHYVPVASYCKGVNIEDIVSQKNKSDLNRHKEFSVFCNKKSIIVHTHNWNVSEKIVEIHEGNKNLLFEEAVLSYDHQHIMLLNNNKDLIRYSVDLAYHP